MNSEEIFDNSSCIYKGGGEEKNKDLENYNNLKTEVPKHYNICLISTYFCENYGAILVSYAVNKILENLGYSVLMLQKPSFIWAKDYTGNTISNIFAKTHYHLSKLYKSHTELIELNDICDNFVVGSDQLFAYGMNINYSTLEFVKNNKNKIAFATSFGHNHTKAPKNIIIKNQYLFDRFNHISLREVSKELCNDIYKINAVELIDPTLMIPQEIYNQLSANINIEIKKPYLLTYLLDNNKEKEKEIRKLSKELGLEIINIENLDKRERKTSKKDNKYYTPEEFLYLYKNASFIVTDSFHGTCFSIKYNKPFISVVNQDRGSLRYKLFDKLNLSNRIIENIQDLSKNNDLKKNIDYTQINNKITEYSDFAVTWLANALKNNTSQEKFSNFENYIDIKLKETDLNQYYKKNKNRIITEYIKYKLLSKMHPNKQKRDFYSQQKKAYKEKVKIIRQNKYRI